MESTWNKQCLAHSKCRLKQCWLLLHKTTQGGAWHTELRLTQHMCGPFSMPQASSVLPENSEAMGGRGGTDERVAEGKPGFGLIPLTHPPTPGDTHSLQSSLCLRSWPSLLTARATHFVLSTGTMMGQVWSPVSLARGGGGGISRTEIVVFAQPGGPSCSLHTAKKCLWMTTAPFSPQI